MFGFGCALCVLLVALRVICTGYTADTMLDQARSGQGKRERCLGHGDEGEQGGVQPERRNGSSCW